jgi:hypothetical protein
LSAKHDQLLSPRYGIVDFDTVSGAASVELPGRNNQTGVALGLRTILLNRLREMEARGQRGCRFLFALSRIVCTRRPADHPTGLPHA